MKKIYILFQFEFIINFKADEENPEILEKAKLEQENLQKLQNLFKGLKFFLNREIPREQFVFAVRSFSGEVSWDKNTALGSTFQEDDAEVTHHIIDRPHIGKNYLNRYAQIYYGIYCKNRNLARISQTLKIEFCSWNQI